MATLIQIRDKANAKLATFWTSLQTRQNAYFAKHDRYFQLLAGSNLVADGVDVPFTVVLPSDEMHQIDIDTSWSDTVPFQIEVHTFDSEKERGYTAIAKIKLLNGDVYVRSRTFIDARVCNDTFNEETRIRTKTWVGNTFETDTGWSQLTISSL